MSTAKKAAHADSVAQRLPYNIQAHLACAGVKREPLYMFDLAAALQAGSPKECTLSAIVTDSPRQYYGSRTHAEHEDFHVLCQGRRLEVVQNLRCSPEIPVQPGDSVCLHGELVPHGSHGAAHALDPS